MTRITISFTIDQDQLSRVDSLAAALDRDRSSTLRQIINAGIPVLLRTQSACLTTMENSTDGSLIAAHKPKEKQNH